ncbi:MAG: type II secretion system protein [Sterolibacterium sp.]
MHLTSDRLFRRVRHETAGFTLVEMIVSIVIVGILAAITALFLRVPFQAYEDITRRANLTDIADSALRRMARDLREALPNSVRVSGPGGSGEFYMEFLQVRTGGRYREEPSGGATACPAGAGIYTDALQIGTVDTCFRSLGAVPNLGSIVTGASGDFLVVYNLGPGFAGADAYASGAATGGNKSRITAVTAGAGLNPEDRIDFQSLSFPLASPSRRFHVVTGPVTYVCNPTAQTLTRQWGYAISAAQATPPLGGGAALLARGVAACNITYNPNAVAQRNGLVSISLAVSQNDVSTGMRESVSLFSQVQVSNTP